MDSHLYHAHTPLSYVAILSYSPMWDRKVSPVDSHLYHTHHYPMCPFYLTLLCGIGRTVLWTPNTTTLRVCPIILSYVYRIGGTIRIAVCEVQMEFTGLSYLFHIVRIDIAVCVVQLEVYREWTCKTPWIEIECTHGIVCMQ